RAASPGLMPASRFRRACISRWKRSSSSRARSARRRERSARRRRRKSVQVISGQFHDAADGGGEAGPLLGFVVQLLPAGRGEVIKAGTPAEFGDTPFSLDPALMLEAMQGGVERALVDPQDVLRDLLDALGDGPAVHGLVLEGAKNEQVESALK